MLKGQAICLAFFMFRMNGIARCHGWQGAYMPREGRYLGFVWNKNQGMFRMNGQDYCSGQILSTYIHVSNSAVPWTVLCSCKNCISTIRGGYAMERICSGKGGSRKTLITGIHVNNNLVLRIIKVLCVHWQGDEVCRE